MKILFRLVFASLVICASAVGAEKRNVPPPKSAATSSARIDVNTADVATLETLPGVGPQTAKAIVAGRPYRSVADLERVAGIGPERLKDLRPLVTASQPGTASAPKKARDSGGAKAPSPTGRINVNTADRQTLESLPGIGPDIAGEIMAARPLPSVDALESVRGIGPARMNELRNLVTVGTSSRIDAANVRWPIDLNTASREELEALPEIGPVKAQAIIEARPFSRVEDVMRVSGIKEATFEAIRDKITVRSGRR